MGSSERRYVPAAGRDWLLPLYDPFTRLVGAESAHRQLLEQAGLQPGQRVLEIGCGTGNLTLLARRLCPGAEFVGLDPDPKALARARQKALRHHASIQFDQGFSQQLPYPDGSFDRVLSALMYHHLQPDVKRETLRQVRRVLRPAGSLHLVDFVAAGEGIHGFVAHFFVASHGGRFSVSQSVLAGMREAGFADAAEVAQRSVLLGKIAFYRAATGSSAA